MLKSAVAALLMAGGAAAQSIVQTLYAEGTSAQANNYGTLNVNPGSTYSVTMEVLRNDLGQADERVTGVTLDGRPIGGCNPDGGDYDCTFFSCPTSEFVISSADGTIDVVYSLTGHSYDCKCNTESGDCVSEYDALTGAVPTTAAVRFTLRDISTVIRHQHNKECHSSDTRLSIDGRMLLSFDECEAQCRATDGCRYFIFGIGTKTGRCLHESTASSTCPEGWEDDEYDFFELVPPTPEHVGVCTYETHQDRNVGPLLTAGDTPSRCAKRFATLDDAQKYCDSDLLCGSVVKDGGLNCGNTHKLYEARGSSGTLSVWNGFTTYIKQCTTDLPSSVLPHGATLRAGEQLTNNGYRLEVQSDGNLVAYNPTGIAYFYSNTVSDDGAQSYLRAQHDGNLVLYSPNGAKWALWGGAAGANVEGIPETPSETNLYLELKENGDIVYTDGSAVYWTHDAPTAAPTAQPTADPTAQPTADPTAQPTADPTAQPTADPTAEPTEELIAQQQSKGVDVDPDILGPGNDNFLDWEMAADANHDVYKCVKDSTKCLINVAAARANWSVSTRPTLSFVDAADFTHNGNDGDWSITNGQAVFTGDGVTHGFPFASKAVVYI